MNDGECRLLELLSASDDGATDTLLVAHGFTLDLMDILVRAGAAAQSDLFLPVGAWSGSRGCGSPAQVGGRWQPSTH